MNRRALLALAGCLVFAGCATGGESAGTDAETTETASSTTEPSTETPEPDTPTVGVPSDEADGPPWDEDVTRVVSWTEAPESSLRLTPPTQEGSLPDATFGFTLENRTNVTFETNFYGWSVWKRADGAWFHVAPRIVPDPLMRLGPDGEHEWTLTVSGTVPESAVEHVEGSESLRLNGLGGGTYAFAVDGWFSTEGYENGVGLAARFELDGDPLELTPSNAVTGTTREGDTVVVDADFETDSTARGTAVVVERVDEEATDARGEVRRVIPEQAVRDQRLRNTLPFFEAGVTTVRLEPTASSWPVFGVRSGVVEYEGTRYRVSEVGNRTETDETTST